MSTRLLPAAPSFGFVPTAAVGSLTAGTYLLTTTGPNAPNVTVLVVSVVILALAALGRKGLTMIVGATAAVVVLGSTMFDLDDRIPTVNDAIDEIQPPALPNVDVDIAGAQADT